MENHIICQQNNGVLEIQLARPNKKNALTNAMYGDMVTAMEQALTDDNVKVILFTAQGDFFTSGNDLADFLAVSSQQPDKSDIKAFRFIELLGDYPKPLVASVTGTGVGIGTTILLHCDLVYIHENAKLLTPFVNLALVPEAGSSLLLTERIGHVRAFNMVALGEPVLGKEAVSLGLANQAFANTDDVLATARQKAEELARKPTQALLQTKQLMRDSAKILAKMQEENICFAERLKSAEAKQIFESFFKK